MPEEPCMFSVSSANSVVLNMIDAIYIYHTEIITKLNDLNSLLQHLLAIQPPSGNTEYSFNFPAHDIMYDVIKFEEIFSEMESLVEGNPSPRGEYLVQYSSVKGSTYGNGEEVI